MVNKFRELKQRANPAQTLDLKGQRAAAAPLGMDLTGKVAIITGGGRGIGRAIAHQLAKAGADICATSDTPEEILRTAEEVRALGVRAAAFPADVRDRKQVEAVVNQCVQTLGEPFILVCCQGIQKQVNTLEISPQLWETMFAVNVTGDLYFIQAVGKYMLQRVPTGRVRGKVILISSITGLRGGRGIGLLPYHTTKGAVVAMTRALAMEWAQYDINVNGIAPGTFLTALSSWTGSTKKERFFLERHIPMAHFKKTAIVPEEEPELIGTMALYFASPASDYTTGQVVAVDGGTVEHFV